MLISTHQEHDASLFNLPTDFKLDSMRSGPATGDLLRRSRPHTVSEPHIPVLKELMWSTRSCNCSENLPARAVARLGGSDCGFSGDCVRNGNAPVQTLWALTLAGVGGFRLSAVPARRLKLGQYSSKARSASIPGFSGNRFGS